MENMTEKDAATMRAEMKVMCDEVRAEMRQEMTNKLSNMEHTYDKLLVTQRDTLIHTFKTWIDGITQNVNQNTEIIGELRGCTSIFQQQIKTEITAIKNDKSSNNEVTISPNNLTSSATLTGIESHVTSLQQHVDILAEDLRKFQNRMDSIEDQSRRNNLKFYGIGETPHPESWETSENLVRGLIREKLKIDDSSIEITRAHRLRKTPDEDESGPRAIIVKFEKFKDRQTILSASRLLKDTTLSISEDFCKKTIEIRKGLVPAMQQARREKKFAKISYRTLVVREHREKPPTDLENAEEE